MRWYLEYRGQKYDIGTKAKIQTRYHGVQVLTFQGWHLTGFGDPYVNSGNVDQYIIEIVEPIYIQPIDKETLQANVKANGYPSQGQVQIAWIWYIVIMLIGFIFKDCWIIWIFATLYFFWWKSKQM